MEETGSSRSDRSWKKHLLFPGHWAMQPNTSLPTSESITMSSDHSLQILLAMSLVMGAIFDWPFFTRIAGATGWVPLGMTGQACAWPLVRGTVSRALVSFTSSEVHRLEAFVLSLRCSVSGAIPFSGLTSAVWATKAFRAACCSGEMCHFMECNCQKIEMGLSMAPPTPNNPPSCSQMIFSFGYRSNSHRSLCRMLLATQGSAHWAAFNRLTASSAVGCRDALITPCRWEQASDASIQVNSPCATLSRSSSSRIARSTCSSRASASTVAGQGLALADRCISATQRGITSIIASDSQAISVLMAPPGPCSS
mmetsp:Transcript_19436/g.47798  ORF Transcript_19436/g.47798 Transcript_19436/m.47798 type:complete len:310 (+) Transcript_19436:3-932(+)